MLGFFPWTLTICSSKLTDFLELQYCMLSENCSLLGQIMSMGKYITFLHQVEATVDILCKLKMITCSHYLHRWQELFIGTTYFKFKGGLSCLTLWLQPYLELLVIGLAPKLLQLNLMPWVQHWKYSDFSR